MKSSQCVLFLSGAAWALCCLGLNAQEKPRRNARSVPTRSIPSHTADEALASAGIATGYRGHFACRSFSGIARSLAIAVSDLEPATVTHLLESGADINARSVAQHAHGMTMLQTAVVHQWGLESIRILIEAGADVNARDRRGDTALTIACRNPVGSDLSVVARLIQAGSAVNGKGAGGMTPLMCAALCDDTGSVVKALIEASADVAARDNRGWTALMHATRRRREHVEIVQLLAKTGADVNARHNLGGTALSNAAYNGHTQSVQFLIRAGADVNSRDSANWTPLICSSMKGHVQIVRLLIDAGANRNVTDRLGRTALRIARSNGQESIEELLVKSGARE